MSKSLVQQKIDSFRPPTAGRSSWTGELVLGSLHIPVKGFTASVASSSSLLHQIHSGCGRRIAQQKNCPTHGPVEVAEVGKAYDFAPGRQVMLSGDELAELQPTADPTLRIEHLLPAERIDLAMLSGRTLHLVPANPMASPAYRIAVHVLQNLRTWGVGTAVLSDRRQLVTVRSLGERLILHVLFWPTSLRSAPEMETPESTLDRAVVNRTQQSLVDIHDPFSWAEYRDEYEARLLKLVGRKVELETNLPKAPVRKPRRKSTESPATHDASKQRRPKAA